MWRLFIFTCLFVFTPLAVQGQAFPDEKLAASGTYQVADVIDGDTLQLADGRQVRLVGIQVPKLPLGRPNFETWPLAEQAKSTLSSLVLGRSITLYHVGREQDRYRRLLAHIVRDDGVWVQAKILEEGLARVYSFADNRKLVPELLQYEDIARSKGRGIWGHDFYKVLQADDIVGRGSELSGRFHVIEGRLISANMVKGRLYLNFGYEWRRDFTGIAEKRAVRLFGDAWLNDLNALVGRRLELRGWVRDENGPMIKITHPEQLRILPNKRG